MNSNCTESAFPHVGSITRQLRTMADPAHAAFTAKLTPGIRPERILGIRIPRLRAFARTLYGTRAAEMFLDAEYHTYYDEDNLHGILLGRIKDPARGFERLEAFLPRIDNWATCDITACGMKQLRRNPEASLARIEHWLESDRTYTVRFAIVVLLSHFLDETFDPAHLERLAALRSDAYYIRMALAWYFSTALVKHYDETLPYLLRRRLDRQVHNKAIQKARESFRIAQSDKIELGKLRY